MKVRLVYPERDVICTLISHTERYLEAEPVNDVFCKDISHGEILEKENDMENMKFDVLKLGNELTTRRYLFNKIQVGDALKAADYIALSIIMTSENTEDIYEGKTYLKELSEKMQLSIRQISKLIGALKDRGLVSWSHDGNGSEGTYVTITDAGRTLYRQQVDVMKAYYGKVIEEFGTENLIQLLNLMKQLETIMGKELEWSEDGNDKSAK